MAEVKNNEHEATGEHTKKKELPILKFGRIVYKGVVLFDCEIEKIEAMEIRHDDIWVCSFPRSGTTLVQEMTYLVRTLDFETAKTVHLDARFPIIEVLRNDLPYYKGVKYVEEMKSPRFVKSHLHYFLLPEQLRKGKGKMIYTTRNPKDSIHSLYKLLSWFKDFDGIEKPFETFFELFMSGKDMINGPWWRHVKEYWAHRDDESMLFLKYEDITKDLPAAIRKIADFLGRDLSDEDVAKIAEHCHIDNMRKNKMLNLDYQRAYRQVDDDSGGFINKGQVGGWVENLTENMCKRVEEMLERELGGTGLTYETS